MDAELKLVLAQEPCRKGREYGRLQAALHFAGEPYWYGEGASGLLDWTWIDLLTFLANNWSALMLEQGYPLPLNNMEHPGKLMEKAEARWESMADERVFAEEARVLEFCDRHNLSAAMPGANLPFLFWLRTGSSLWLVQQVDDADRSHRVDFQSLRLQLEKVGDQLAGMFSHSSQAHVRKTISLWENRHAQLHADYLRYTTGLGLERLTDLQKEVELELPTEKQILQQEPVYLAAARMGRHHLTNNEIAMVIRKLQQAKTTGLQVFAEFSEGADRVLELFSEEKPYEQGYRLAQWLRNNLELNSSERFDPEQLLQEAGVAIQTVNFNSTQIDAIACWGDIDPLILLNKAKSGGNRRRTTLAHELCHLLVDRKRALPVAEVLGGEVDDDTEKRANAFAAEILLPRDFAVQVLQDCASIEIAVQKLSDTHMVGWQLIANHLLNTAYGMLAEDERVYLESIRAGSSA